MRRARYLVLSDGTVFEGEAFGADCSAVGELVFTTGMCGYLETITDPSYTGQIVMQTFPLIGNYGVIPEDFEGECRIKGYVVRELCENPFNFRCAGNLSDYLRQQGVPGIQGIDTRYVTKLIRSHGVMNAMLCDHVPDDLSLIQKYVVKDAVKEASCRKDWIKQAEQEEKYHVVLIDYGMKKNIVKELTKRGCRVHVVPYDTCAEAILAEDPDGIMLSNGPGDPSENVQEIAEIKKLLGKKPIFGICLGHQLTALAMGGKTYKMKYGHRGVNQPVKDRKSGRTWITTQNHGYAVEEGSVKSGEVRWINANDGTCEGIEYPSLSCFTVQFHPEACPGPKDTSFLFDRFVSMMEASDAKR